MLSAQLYHTSNNNNNNNRRGGSLREVCVFGSSENLLNW